MADITNRIPATDQTLYRVASITRTFTATAVMQLVEQGRLSLDDPVDKHLPWFTPKNADPAQPIRIWHLLSHTAGLMREAPGTHWDEFESPDAIHLRSATPATPLMNAMQSRLKYSNYGFAVAGELVAQVAGGPFLARDAPPSLSGSGLERWIRTRLVAQPRGEAGGD